MKNKMKNKKAAFEMSITTIVILVIAVIMLIMGLVFVRTTMCKGLNLATTSLDGAEKEINKLFGENQGEVSCMGVGQTLNIVPGEYNIVGCGFKPTVQKTYDYVYKVTSAKDINGANINYQGWINEGLSGQKIASPANAEYATFAIRPTDDAPEGLITIDATITAGGKVVSNPTMRLYIKRASFVQKSVC